MDQELLCNIITRVLAGMSGYSLFLPHPEPIPVGVSNRHLHLSSPDLEILFGAGYQLIRRHDLLQPGQFAAAETVIIAGPKGCIERVSVLGPLRKKTQIEISRSDGYRLGLNPPIRESGKLLESCGVTLIGPKGSVLLREGLIIAQRHIHMSLEDAVRYEVADGENVQVRTGGERNLIFDKIAVRVNRDFVLEFHLDIDEANAAGIGQGDSVNLLTRRSLPIKMNSNAPQAVKEKALKESPLSLITEDIVKLAWKNKTAILASQNAIVSPLARDTIKDLGVEVIRGDQHE